MKKRVLSHAALLWLCVFFFFFFFFFFTLVAGRRRSLSLKLSDTRVLNPAGRHGRECGQRGRYLELEAGGEEESEGDDEEDGEDGGDEGDAPGAWDTLLITRPA